MGRNEFIGVLNDNGYHLDIDKNQIDFDKSKPEETREIYRAAMIEAEAELRLKRERRRGY